MNNEIMLIIEQIMIMIMKVSVEALRSPRPEVTSVLTECVIVIANSK